MRIAYVVTAYKKPEQLARMVSRLNDAESGFFIHVDRCRDISRFMDALQGVPNAQITLVKREYSRWGSIGMVEAILGGMRSVVGSERNYGYVVLLSGQDYPIKNSRHIHEFFERNRGRNFIDFDETGERTEELKCRIERYHFRALGRKLMYPYPHTKKKLKKKLYEAIVGLRFRTPRVFPTGLTPHIGETSWNLSIEAVQYIVSFVEERRDFLRFHRHTHCPDEGFFQTILLSARDDRIGDTLVNNPLRYIKWLPGRNHPEILTVEDYEALVRSDALFARKFDTDIDSKIMDMLDASFENAT